MAGAFDPQHLSLPAHPTKAAFICKSIRSTSATFCFLNENFAGLLFEVPDERALMAI
jgi:hypothetical protein